jgi:Zn-dependent protease with chaperone function
LFALIVLAGMVDALRQADARVAAIAWRLQTANVASCPNVVPLAGFSIETLDQYQVAERREAAAKLGLHDRPQVSAVAPDSAAAKAGLKVGDDILAVNDAPTPRTRGRRPSYDTTAAAVAAVAKALAAPPAKLTLADRTLMLTGDSGCASDVQLVPDTQLDASADGHYVQISGPMYEFAEDESELAFVIAHELAHNIYPEAKRVPGSGKGQRLAEFAADRFAIDMMARAGYDPARVVPFLQRLSGRSDLSSPDAKHPPWPSRIAMAQAEVRAIGERKARSEP